MANARRTLERRLGAIVLLLWGLGALPVASCAELRALAANARSILGAEQGVYVEAADGTVLVSQAAAIAVHPASVSKVPTTLALLRKLGPDYRFVTTFAAAGPIVGDRLEGDLLVESDGDPALVDENALLVAQRLNELGIKRVLGDLRARGPLMFDWQADADAARLRAALSGRAPALAWSAVRALAVPAADNSEASSVAPPAIEFTATAMPLAPAAERPLLVHRSEPLLSLAKALNDYSNNVFNALASSAGGAAEIERVARASVPEGMRSEIVLGDGAGADPRNRLSPRAAVAVLRALEHELQAHGHALTDILPVAGVDAGTLHDRLHAAEETGRVVGKTGTFGDYGASALIGAVRTADRGTVYFAILDHGLPVPEARGRQDRFVQQLIHQLHALPWNYARDPRPAIARVQVVTPRS